MGDNKGFSKTDMERVALFQEMGYISINDKYKSGGSMQFNEAATKGKQLLPGGVKSKSALQAGYFNDKFGRILEGEAYTDPIKMRRQRRIKESQKNVGKPFLPSSGEKKPSGLGNHYGTLGGPVSAFSPIGRPGKQYKVPGKNILTSPSKKGTGYGYVNVTLGTYQKYAPDNYDRYKELTKKANENHKKSLKGGAFKLNMAPKALFDENPFRSDKSFPSGKRSAPPRKDLKPFKPSSPAKMPGGMKAGTFDPYPSHPADPYKVKVPRSVNVVNKTGKTFLPSMGPKSAPSSSILNANVVKQINTQNYKVLTSVMSY